jgi:hypothetical protein
MAEDSLFFLSWCSYLIRGLLILSRSKVILILSQPKIILILGHLSHCWIASWFMLAELQLRFFLTAHEVATEILQIAACVVLYLRKIIQMLNCFVIQVSYRLQYLIITNTCKFGCFFHAYGIGPLLCLVTGSRTLTLETETRLSSLPPQQMEEDWYRCRGIGLNSTKLEIISGEFNS